jgi:GTPase SAR1 family protein
MGKIIKAQKHIKCSARTQYHMNEVFEKAIKIVLHPPNQQTTSIKTEHQRHCCEVA